MGTGNNESGSFIGVVDIELVDSGERDYTSQQPIVTGGTSLEFMPSRLSSARAMWTWWKIH